MKVTVFTSYSDFVKEFEKCTLKYSKLEIYSAWVGNPDNNIPFSYLDNLNQIEVVVGISFFQSHPNGIRFLMSKAKVKIAREDTLFHPKVYIFSDNNAKSIFIGSSNFTYQGFQSNHEANILIESQDGDSQIEKIKADIQKWRTDKYSFTPDTKWLLRYEEEYWNKRQKMNDLMLTDEAEVDANISNTFSWLSQADWKIYFKKVCEGIGFHRTHYNESIDSKLNIFGEYETNLSVPWNMDYFKSIEKRRMMLGNNKYGWLGHVGASGRFRQLLAKGTQGQHYTIVTSINKIANLTIPMDWENLERNLQTLTSVGPTMKVWGRILAIIRPDLFCTVSSITVREKMGDLLGVSEKNIISVEGYLKLLNSIYSSPWFSSKMPVDQEQQEIWKRRVAFLDVVFYDNPQVPTFAK